MEKENEPLVWIIIVIVAIPSVIYIGYHFYMEARKPENLSTINIIENNNNELNNNELYLVTEPCNCSNETSYYWAEDMICIGQNCTGSCHATTEICFDPEWLKQFKHALEEIER